MKKTIFDSHTHIHFPAYDLDREAVIKRAREVGVKMITVGTQISTSESAIKLAEKYPDDIWATVGFHPNHVVDINHSLEEEHKVWHHDENEQEAKVPEIFDIEKLREFAKNPKVVAIGECGLDYYRVASNKKQETSNKQKEIFIEQLKLAEELHKPIMIHCRPSKGTDDAYEELFKIVGSGEFSINKILHFYVGSLSMTKKFVEAGFYFTFGGVITFARDYDEIIKYIPMDRILLETDAPYIAPELYRGKRNEPSFILEAARKMAEIKGLTYDKIEALTSENATKVFKIVL